MNFEDIFSQWLENKWQYGTSKTLARATWRQEDISYLRKPDFSHKKKTQ